MILNDMCEAIKHRWERRGILIGTICTTFAAAFAGQLDAWYGAVLGAFIGITIAYIFNWAVFTKIHPFWLHEIKPKLFPNRIYTETVYGKDIINVERVT